MKLKFIEKMEKISASDIFIIYLIIENRCDQIEEEII